MIRYVMRLMCGDDKTSDTARMMKRRRICMAVLGMMFEGILMLRRSEGE